MIDKLVVGNVHEIPKLYKIVIFSGINCKHENAKTIAPLVKVDLFLLTGAKPVCIKAKTSVANFNIRQGQIIGYKVTLRSGKLNSFIDKLLERALPKSKTFSGIKLCSFDANFNVTFGIADYSIFSDETNSIESRILGLNVTLCIKAKCLEHSIALLDAIGFNILK
ncbi:MAG: 50S ribosomal protein L5 [Candidatus Hodgkinia cicadicola]